MASASLNTTSLQSRSQNHSAVDEITAMIVGVPCCPGTVKDSSVEKQDSKVDYSTTDFIKTEALRHLIENGVDCMVDITLHHN